MDRQDATGAGVGRAGRAHMRSQDRLGQRTALLVDTPRRFATFLATLSAVQSRTLGLDTEAANVDEDLYRESPSLLQLAFRRPDGAVQVGVLDLLALGDVRLLQPHLLGARTVVFAHNWAYDERMLLRLGLRPRCVYDTCQAGRLLFEGAGRLADLSERLLAAPLDKTLQTSDWGRRPLSREQIAYAARDAADTLAIGEMVRPLLPDIPAPRPALPPAAQGPYRALLEWRAATAGRTRRFPEDILPQRALRQIALQRPSTLDALGQAPGIGPTRLQRYGLGILTALAQVDLASLVAGTPLKGLQLAAAALEAEGLRVRLAPARALADAPRPWPPALERALEQREPWRLLRAALGQLRLRCAIAPPAQPAEEEPAFPLFVPRAGRGA